MVLRWEANTLMDMTLNIEIELEGDEPVALMLTRIVEASGMTYSAVVCDILVAAAGVARVMAA